MRIMMILGMLLALTPILIACTSDKNLAAEAADDAMVEAGIKGYSSEEGKAKSITTEDSESHQMIVKMRLLQYGMSPNLDDYRDAYLVDMKNDAGKTITVVVVNEDGTRKALLPENIE